MNAFTPAIASRQARGAALALVPLALLAALFLLEPIRQPVEYHAFADRRTLLGVPNLIDVVSNLGFLGVGALGLALCAGPQRPQAAASWRVVFAAAALTAFGSAYYHWAPDDARLFWDRLPMAIGFMALWLAITVEQIGAGVERYLLAPAVVAGAMSVLWWRWTGDLRPYVWVQFAPVVCIPLALALFPARYTHPHYVFYTLAIYAVAKIAEFGDAKIFRLTGGIVSGHTLKHLLAAGAILALVAMLWRREPTPE